MCTKCPAHPILLGWITLTIFVEAYKYEVLPVQSSSYFCYCLSLRSTYSPQHLVHKHPQSILPLA
jgi:hypothetical protein